MELLNSLATMPEQAWLAQGRACVLRGDIGNALAVFEAAVSRFPQSSELCLGLAGTLWQAGQGGRAEEVLAGRLDKHPADAGAAFLLASLLREQGRLRAAGSTLLSLFEHGPHGTDTVIRAIEMLDDYGRQREALAICENALSTGTDDPRLHAYAGMLGIQLGHFEQVRRHYAQALSQTPEAVNWNIPLGLAGLQRYSSPDHPDFAFFLELLQRPGIHHAARQSALFALGKAYDDVGDFAAATSYLQQANAMARAERTWSRKQWKRSIEARLAAPPDHRATVPPEGWTPVFIVGVPRSGTTLLAQRLARYPQVKNRGELGWLEFWEQRLASAPGAHASWQEAASHYARQLLQDDGRAGWYIDKQPLNLLRVGLAMTLWPHARIIHCERNARDTALSLWSQSFHDTAHDYAYDFGDIAAVIRDCRRLAAHWKKRYPGSFLTVHYEQLVEAPDATLDGVAQWLGVHGTPDDTASAGESISTASVWQARQPIYTHAAGRWQHYAPHIPELLTLPEH